MTPLTEREIAALRTALARNAVAIYLPETGQIFTCPDDTVPRAEARATEMARAGLDAHVLVYGMPWATRHAQKPAQGA